MSTCHSQRGAGARSVGRTRVALVSAGPACRHVRALADAGWTVEGIAEESGVDAALVVRLGWVDSGERPPQILPAQADALLGIPLGGEETHSPRAASGVGATAELRHGWTLAALDRLAHSAAACNYFMAGDFSDLHHAALTNIVDTLYAAQEPPTRHDLAYAGKAGVWGLVREHRRIYGFRDRDGWAGVASAPRFVAYWSVAREFASPFEDAVLERMALVTVWPCLSDRHREVLGALAVHDDYRDAADALGIPDGSYRQYVSAARRAFLALWHDEETPRRQQGYNRRHHRVEVQACPSLAAYRRHKAHGEPVDTGCAEAAREYDRARKARRASAVVA